MRKRMGPGPSFFASLSCLESLEVVSHADGRAEDVPPLVGDENGVTERGHFGDHAAVLGANIEAGADLIRNADSVNSADFGGLLYIQRLGARVANRLKNEGRRAGFDKRIELFIVELTHITGGNLLSAGGHFYSVGKRRKYVFEGVLVSDTVADF